MKYNRCSLFIGRELKMYLATGNTGVLGTLETLTINIRALLLNLTIFETEKRCYIILNNRFRV